MVNERQHKEAVVNIFCPFEEPPSQFPSCLAIFSLFFYHFTALSNKNQRHFWLLPFTSSHFFSRNTLNNSATFLVEENTKNPLYMNILFSVLFVKNPSEYLSSHYEKYQVPQCSQLIFYELGFCVICVIFILFVRVL